MSVKLGDTNIAGTQVLYSTTGNNTDGAMTQSAITTQLNLKANESDVIHKTGDENYTGLKTNIVTLDLSQRNYTTCNDIKTNMDATVVQSFYQDFYTDIIRDTNNNFFSWNATVIGTDKSVNKQLAARCKNTANTGNVTSTIQVCASPNGTTWATAPASDANGSIVTTVNKSKNTNGYFKLGNGLIIQWGHVTGTSQDRTVTMPTAMSSATSYVAIVTRTATAVSGDYVNIAGNKTSTNFHVYVNTAFDWLVIGY